MTPRQSSRASVLFVADDDVDMYINGIRKRISRGCYGRHMTEVKAALKEGDVISFVISDTCRINSGQAGLRAMINLGSAVVSTKNNGWETKRPTYDIPMDLGEHGKR